VRRAYYLLVLAALAYCVFIRGALDEQALTSNSWLTSHTLLTLKIFEAEGALKHAFAPVCSFSAAPGDAFIPTLYGLMGANGANYYVSYPPLGYLVPYAVATVLGLSPSAVLLTIINIGAQLVTALCLFGIVWTVLAERREEERFAGAFLALCVYLFSASPLHLHTFDYFVDAAAQPLFAASIFACVRLRPDSSTWAIATVGLLCMLLTLTEWIGVFFAMAVAIAAAVRLVPVRAAIAAGVGAMLAVAIMVLQYAQIDGLMPLLHHLAEKYHFRSGLDSRSEGGMTVYELRYWKSIVHHYWAGYGTVLVLGTCLTLGAIALRRSLKLPRLHLLALGLAALPVLAHHVVFFNFTTRHAFSANVAGILLALISGLAFASVLRHRPAWIALPVALVLSIGLAAMAEPPRPRRDSPLRIDAQWIGREAQPDESICILKRPYVDPRMLVYARRNIAPCKTLKKTRSCTVRRRVTGPRGAAFLLLDCPAVK